jgi:hypothetical protein
VIVRSERSRQVDIEGIRRLAEETAVEKRKEQIPTVALTGLPDGDVVPMPGCPRWTDLLESREWPVANRAQPAEPVRLVMQGPA